MNESVEQRIATIHELLPHVVVRDNVAGQTLVSAHVPWLLARLAEAQREKQVLVKALRDGRREIHSLNCHTKAVAQCPEDGCRQATAALRAVGALEESDV